jgi:HlyD family secretion protein
MRIKRLAILVLVIIVAAVVSFQVYTRVILGSAPTQTPPQTAIVQRGNVAATVSASGSVVSQHTSTLTFRSSGRVTEVNVFPGSAVTKGQVLAKIDPIDLQVQLDQAKVGLVTAQIKLDTIKDGARPEDIASAQAQVDQAAAKLESMKIGGRAEDIATSQASLESVQAGLEKVMRPYTGAEIRAQEAAEASAQSALQTAQIALNKLQVPDPTEVATAQVELERAKNSLNQTYISRDLTCSQRGKDSADCLAAKASAAAAEAPVKTAQLNLADLKAGGKPQEIAQAQAAVQSAQIQLNSTQQKLAEMKAGAKPEDLTQAQAAVTQAQQNLALKAVPYTAQDIAQQAATLVQAQQSLALKTAPYTERDLQAAQAAVDSAQTVVTQAQYNLEAAVLTAPFDGVVSAVGYSVGTLSSSGGTVGAAAITLIDTQNLRLSVNVDETDVPKLLVGQPATITFDALTGVQFQGKVMAISPSAEVNSGVVTFPASISLDYEQSGYKVGMSGTALVVVAQRSGVLTLPNKAVRTVGKDRLVLVLEPGTGKTVSKPVAVGLSNETTTEITSGLNEGEVTVIQTTTTKTGTSSGPGMGIPGTGTGGPPSGGGPPPG